MKNPLIIILLFAILFAGCTSKEETVIADYVQKIDGVKTDLKFKLVSVKEEGVITGKDSAYYYEAKIDLNKTLIIGFQKDIDAYNKKYAAYEEIKQKFQTEYGNSITSHQQEIEKDSVTLDYFNKIADQKLGIKKTVVYKVINPQLNNVEQELTKTFVFSTDGNRIIGESKL